MSRFLILLVAAITLLSACGEGQFPTSGALGELPDEVHVSDRACSNDGTDCKRVFTFAGHPIEDVLGFASAAGYTIDPSLPLLPPRACHETQPAHCAVLVDLADGRYLVIVSGP